MGRPLLRAMAMVIPAVALVLLSMLLFPDSLLPVVLLFILPILLALWIFAHIRWIRARLCMEQDLNLTRSKLTAILIKSPDAIVMLDDDDHVLLANRATKTLFGLARMPETGRQLSTSCRLPNWDTFRGIGEGESVPLEWQARRESDGETIEMDIVISSTVIDKNPVMLIHMRDVTEQKRMESVLIKNEEKCSMLFDSVDEGILLLDGNVVSDVNAMAVEMFGYSTRDLVGMTPEMLSAPKQRDGIASAEAFGSLTRMLDDGRPRTQFSWTMKRKDGSFFDSEVTMVRRTLDDVVVEMMFVRDVTERLTAERERVAQLEELLATREVLSRSNGEITVMYRELEQAGEKMERQVMHLEHARQELLRSTERYRLVTEGSNDIIWDWDVRTRKLYLSDRFYDLMGYNPVTETITYDMWKNMVHPDDRAAERLAYNEHLSGRTPRYSVEKRMREKNGSWRWFLASGRMMLDESGGLRRFAGSLTDIAERKHQERIIGSLAYFDHLTGLPNRTRLLGELEMRIAECDRTDACGALMFLDLDDFKVVNDTFGHSFGDRVLQQVAERIRQITERWPDTLIARFGGDEFMVMLPRMNDPDRIIAFGNEILQMFHEPVLVDGARLGMTCSIGVARYPQDADTSESLLKHADTAVNRAKRSGKKQVALFSQEMEVEISARMEMVAALREGIEHGELQLYYQPIIRTDGLGIVGFEALVRWNGSKYGFVPPARFIELAEETGLIFPLGKWVIEEACRFAREVNALSADTLSISVNVAPIQFLQGDLAEEIQLNLDKTGISSCMLGVEITESTLVENFPLVTDTMAQMKAIGLHLYLDDFGTGYSSLSYLRRLPIDTLKIDKSFIDGIHIDHTERQLVQSIVQMAHGLDIRVVAEGVEHLEQAEVLREIGCDMMQGYHFSRPLPGKLALELLHDTRFAG